MHSFGKFVLFIQGSFIRIESIKTLFNTFTDECIKVGYKSIFIVVIVSTFTGAVSAIQTAYNLETPYVKDFVIALIVRDTIFSLIPTLMALVFAGKVGSNLSSELGSMRITEQIDALEVMGINSKSYLILPKILASMLMFPLLIITATFMAVSGGFIASVALDIISSTEYIRGIRTEFNPFIITVILIKACVFAFLITTISCFKGYYTTGGALQVGQASTTAVVRSCIAILVSEYLLTEILL